MGSILDPKPLTKQAADTTYAPANGSANYAAKSVEAAQTKTDTLARLRNRFAGDERIRGMATKPPYDAPLMATPPTVTESTTLDAALVKSWSQTLSNVYRWDAINSTGATPRYYTFADNSGVAASVPTAQVAFDTDADHFAFLIYGRSGMKYRLWVNEQAVTVGFTAITTINNNAYVHFNFGSYSTSPRRIVLEIECTSAPIQFFGVRTKNPASVLPPSIRSPRAMLVGDSFGTGAGALNFLEGYGRTLGRLLGIADFWTHFSSVGSTGLVAAPSATVGNFKSRLAGDIIPAAPELVIIQGSQNDKPHVDLNLIGPALIDYVNTLKASLPNCLVVVTGLAWIANPDAGHMKINNELRTAAATLGVPFIDLISPVQFFTGTGNTTTAAGDGNADRYRNPDNSHPSQAGHYALAQILAGRIREAISKA